ncbi:MAG: DEAD/DEAH box helicase [Anaerolineaceae bacterium]|nr:DEAD/DEAH box helicase [Anaerolineaceae bacterium]
MGKEISRKWIIQQNTLAFELSDGTIRMPNAEEVYSVLFGRISKNAGIILISNSPEDALHGLKPSRYPLNLEGRISIKEKNGEFVIFLSIWATHLAFEVYIQDFFERSADHIIYNGIWYPFSKGAFELFKKICSINEIGRSGIINLKQYLELLRQKEAPILDLTDQQIYSSVWSTKLHHLGHSPSFIGKLYPYQEQGFRWLSMMLQNNLGCILADEMGLGKTVQVIAVLSRVKKQGVPILIICPTTLITNWFREFRQFAPDMRILPHQGPERTGFPSVFKKLDVVLTSYETALRDINLLKMLEWNVLVLDEAQAIKNPEAKRTVAIKQIPRKSAIAMTGTPVENCLTDLWSISDLAIPGFLGTKYEFEMQFRNDRESAFKLEPVISPILLRRTIDEVANDLPEKIDIPQPLTMEDEMVDFYEQIRQQSMEQYGAAGGLAALIHLRMFCAHPILVAGGRKTDIEISEKYRRLIEILDEIFSNQRKTLIFTSFTEMINILVNDIRDRFGVYCGRIDGQVAINDRQLIVDEFSNVSGSGALILNPRAGGTGLNITAANHVIHYNPEWNPAIEDQASARAYRRGQTRPVTIHRLFYENTIEEIIQERLTRKRKLSKTAVVGVDGSEDDEMDILKALRISPKAGH